MLWCENAVALEKTCATRTAHAIARRNAYRHTVEISQGPAARTAPLLGASLEPTLTWISAIRSYFMAAFSQSPFPSSQMVDSLWKSGIAAAEPMTRHRRMNFMRL